MSICTRGWLYHYLKCQARKPYRLTVRWTIISIPQPGIAVGVDYVGPLPVTPRGNTYIMLFTFRFQPPSLHVRGHCRRIYSRGHG